MNAKITVKVISEIIWALAGRNCMVVQINNGKMYNYEVNLNVAERVKCLISHKRYGKALDLLKKFNLA